MVIKGLLTLLGYALLLALLAVPLLRRRVSRNLVYGFRTGKTLGDERPMPIAAAGCRLPP